MSILVPETRAGVGPSVSPTNDLVAVELVFDIAVARQCSMSLTSLAWCEADDARLDACLTVAVVGAAANLRPRAITKTSTVADVRVVARCSSQVSAADRPFSTDMPLATETRRCGGARASAGTDIGCVGELGCVALPSHLTVDWRRPVSVSTV